MNANYRGNVTLAHNSSDRIVQFSFGIADCGKMRGSGTGPHNSFRPILTVALLSCACTLKSGKIKSTK